MTIHNPKLISTEISLLWTTYLQDSLAYYILKHFQLTNEDTSLNPILSFALECSNEHIQQVSTLFKQEGIPIPDGFTEEDWNQDAPKLFPDLLMYRFLEHMSRAGLTNYALGKSTCVRKDVRELAGQWLKQSNQLYDIVIDTMLRKGILVRSPSLAYPTEKEYVQKATFFTDGFLDEDRPLLAVEISHLGANIEGSLTVAAMMLAYSQVAEKREVRDLLYRGHKIAKKHAEVFSQVLRKEAIHAPSGWDSDILGSTTPPFSDKLITNNVSAMISIGINNYGSAIGASLRRDLGINYVRLITELANYAEDLAEFMIKQQWMEKPPQNLNREELVKKKR
ncbi:hypothetical protein HNQ94_000806 [Salirhabdus euzebyi]|uniref:DUF3231 family protein n=1 Tax=Salirhabdus euzebyi TaxID=394506 RepID=A0A841PYX7_9BACI|nr:DUF3231 family protein [Salirhabdus euzebyi]MBB6452361.1 hypothetical protein [Salirhabdus euzebyi]